MRVTNDPHDLYRRVAIRSDEDELPDGILSRPVAPCGGLRHDDSARCGPDVGRGERAAANDRDAEKREVSWRHAVYVDEPIVVVPRQTEGRLLPSGTERHHAGLGDAV